MKHLLLLGPLLLASCAAPSGSPSGSSSNPSSPGSDSERDEMGRKLITFQQSYDRFDDNGDGYLSRSEVANGLANDRVEGTTPDSVALIFAFYDTNKDGRISLAEINAGYEAGPDAALRLKAARAAQQ